MSSWVLFLFFLWASLPFAVCGAHSCILYVWTSLTCIFHPLIVLSPCAHDKTRFFIISCHFWSIWTFDRIDVVDVPQLIYTPTKQQIGCRSVQSALTHKVQITLTRKHTRKVHACYHQMFKRYYRSILGIACLKHKPSHPTEMTTYPKCLFVFRIVSASLSFSFAFCSFFLFVFVLAYIRSAQQKHVFWLHCGSMSCFSLIFFRLSTMICLFGWTLFVQQPFSLVGRDPRFFYPSDSASCRSVTTAI